MSGVRPASNHLTGEAQAPQQRLYFLPLPHGHGSLRPTLGAVLATGRDTC